ncbi:MAG: hypothetical protein IKZ09_00225, partial [Clostridia bacterium]|nr:hypothetical protein [Clostridia bacterium]
GLAVVIVGNAAEQSPYQSDSPTSLAAILSEMKTCPCVRAVAHADDVTEALHDLGIAPYTAFSSPNRRILTQTRRDGVNRLIYAYNFGDETLLTEQNPDVRHTTTTELAVEGRYLPFAIDSWSGKVTQVPARHTDDGHTVFSLTLADGDIALYCLEPMTDTDQILCVPEVRTCPEYPITDWTLTVESWTPSEDILSRTEELYDVTTTEYAVRTEKQQFHTALVTPAAGDTLADIGKTVSGIGYYRASFVWDGTHAGAYLDFGRITQSIRVRINGAETDAVNMNIPCIDITECLCVGVNTVEVTYKSNLNNLQISRGKVKEGILVNNFPGYLTGYAPYGLRKAIIIPYDLAPTAE